MKDKAKELVVKLSPISIVLLKSLYLLPFGNKWREFLRILRMYLHPVSRPMLKTFKYEDMTLTANISETIGGNMFYLLKDPESDIVEKLVKEGDVCLDVGANMGLYCLKMAKKASVVYALEPSTKSRNLLLLNTLANNAANIVSDSLALGDRQDIKELFTNQESGTSSFNKNIGTVGSEFIKCDTLNNFAKDFERLDFIKIDVEGYDGKVIEGGLQTIEKFKPIIFVELRERDLAKFGDSRVEIIKKLEAIGYVTLIVNRQNWRIEPLTETNADLGINFVFKP